MIKDKSLDPVVTVLEGFHCIHNFLSLPTVMTNKIKSVGVIRKFDQHVSNLSQPNSMPKVRKLNISAIED